MSRLWTLILDAFHRLVLVAHRYVDLIPRIVDHFIAATKETDNRTPSSARVNGTLIILATLLLEMAILGVLCWKILKLDPGLPTAPAILALYIRVLLVFLVTSMLFNLATALSLYGVNVWRYVAAMRCGTIPKDDPADDDAKLPTIKDVVADVKAAVTGGASTTQVTPPPGPVE